MRGLGIHMSITGEIVSVGDDVEYYCPTNEGGLRIQLSAETCMWVRLTTST